MYYVFDDEKGIEVLEQICPEDDVHEMWEASNKSPQACLEIIGSFRYAQSIPFSDSFITE